MGKFHIGELVRFREAEISLSAIPSLSVKLKTDNLSGKVTGLIDCGPEETKYYVDVKMPVKDMVVNVTLKESELMTIEEYAKKVIDDIVEKIVRPENPFMKFFSKPIKPISEELSDQMASIRKDLNPSRYVLGIDLGHYYSKIPENKDEDKKMSKMRCIKLLESYRAEREKVKSGRKFERCLRDNVVDEALERAIELLKSDLK